MSILSTVKDIMEASDQSPNRGETTGEQSDGAYWCYDCKERLLDLEVEGDDPPDCPECGEEMEFDRSAASTGCAC